MTASLERALETYVVCVINNPPASSIHSSGFRLVGSSHGALLCGAPWQDSSFHWLGFCPEEVTIERWIWMAWLGCARHSSVLRRLTSTSYGQALELFEGP